MDGLLDHTWLVDVTLRASDANQMGILGFGGPDGNYHLLAEGSVGVFLTDFVVFGGEYRQKPNNLTVFHESDYADVLLVLYPVKYLSLTVAYADLGTIANQPRERGTYFSLQASW